MKKARTSGGMQTDSVLVGSTRVGGILQLVYNLKCSSVNSRVSSLIDRRIASGFWFVRLLLLGNRFPENRGHGSRRVATAFPLALPKRE